MKLENLIKILQDSIGNSNETIFKVGLNTEEKKQNRFNDVIDFEYHIYISFNHSMLSEIYIYEISSIYDKKYRYSFKEFDRMVKSYGKGLFPLGCAETILKKAIKIKIDTIDDIVSDLDTTYNKIYEEYNRYILEEKEKRNQSEDIISTIPDDLITALNVDLSKTDKEQL